MKKYLLVILFLSFISAAKAGHQRQDVRYVADTPKYKIHLHVEEHISLLVGYNLGWCSFGEIGLARTRFANGICFSSAGAYYLSSEFRLSDKLLIGPKIGCSFYGPFFGLGMNALYYTDFKDGSFRLRPELGIGMDNFKFAYGYNVALNNRKMEGVNTNVLSFVLFIPVKTTKEIVR